METFRDILEESYFSYKSLQETVEKAVRFAEKQEFSLVVSTVAELKDQLEDVKTIDQKLFKQTDQLRINENLELWGKRSQQIEQTLHFHQENLPRLQSIMAMQQSEIKKIRSGIRGVSGYHTGTSTAGNILQSSS